MIGSESTESYLVRLASREPTPGGGAAGALHAAQGAALLAMVARYSTGPRYADFEAEASEILASADALASASLSIADDDEAAFAAVIAAYQRPKEGDVAQGGAAEAARAAAATARVNLEINLVGIRDPDALALISTAIESADQVIEQAESLSDRVRKQILS